MVDGDVDVLADFERGGGLGGLLHHATVVITDGDSYRMTDAQHRKDNAKKIYELAHGANTFIWPPVDTSTWPLTGRSKAPGIRTWITSTGWPLPGRACYYPFQGAVQQAAHVGRWDDATFFTARGGVGGADDRSAERQFEWQEPDV